VRHRRAFFGGATSRAYQTIERTYSTALARAARAVAFRLALACRGGGGWATRKMAHPRKTMEQTARIYV